MSSTHHEQPKGQAATKPPVAGNWHKGRSIPWPGPKPYCGKKKCRVIPSSAGGVTKQQGINSDQPRREKTIATKAQTIPQSFRQPDRQQSGDDIDPTNGNRDGQDQDAEGQQQRG